MPAATVTQCAVLVGGLGTRLGAITAATPKPLLPCGGRPFLAWLMREMMRFGIEEFVLLTGHLSEEVVRASEAIRTSLPRPPRIVVAEEPVRAGTGGAVYHARDRLQDRFLLCNGDSLFDCNIAALLAAAAQDDAGVAGRMLLRRVEDASRYGVVALQGDRVAAFQERPAPGTPGTINAGIYLFSRQLLEVVQPVCSLERDVMTPLAAAGRLRGSLADGYFRDIGIPEDYARADTELPRLLRRPALLLGLSALLPPGGDAPADQHGWAPGAMPAIGRATAAGWHVFVIADAAAQERVRVPAAGLAAWMLQQVQPLGGTVTETCCLAPAEDPALRLQDLLRRWELDVTRCLLVDRDAGRIDAAQPIGVPGRILAGQDVAQVVTEAIAGPAFGDWR